MPSNVMRGVLPYLFMAGRTAEAIDFFARAFGAEDIGRVPFPDGSPGLMHGQVLINRGVLMMTDNRMNPGGPDRSRIEPHFGHLQLVVDDGSGWWRRAVAAGCVVVSPYARQPWGDDWGLLEDPFGLKWAIMQDGSIG
jgi:PhnB protein